MKLPDKLYVVPLLALVVAWSGGMTAPCSAAIMDGLVFAYDFEQVNPSQPNTVFDISGNGNHGTKGSAWSYDTSAPIDWPSQPFNSTRHIQAPGNNAPQRIVTGTHLTTPLSALSFSAWYNDRGDNGGDTSTGMNNLARLLSSYVGFGGSDSQFAASFYKRPSVAGEPPLASDPRVIRFSSDGEFVDSLPIPEADAQWHQAGFVFESGTVTFYFDGAQLGTPQTLTNTQVVAQTYPWYLFEDHQISSAQPREYFDNGDYDEAGLWYRALSAAEMNRIYSRGIVGATVPEPSTVVLLAAGCAALGIAAYRKRKVVEQFAASTS